MESGAFNFDKLSDSAKEGFLLMSEGSDEVRDAIGTMGLDANQVIADINAGGDDAQQAFMAVSTALASIEDPAERNRLAIAAFGTPLEDLGPQFATFFGEVNQDLGNFEGATQRAGDALRDNIGDRLTSAFRTLGSGLVAAWNESGGAEFVDGLVTKFEESLPKIEELAGNVLSGFTTGLQWISDNKDTIISGLAGITGGLAAFGILTGINKAISIFNTLMIAFRTGTIMATLAQWGLNTALLANPLTWVAVAIGLVIAAGVLLYQNWDTVKTKAGELWAKVKEVFGGIYNWGMTKIQPVVSFFSDLKAKFDGFKNAITSFKMPKWVNEIGGKLSSAASKIGGIVMGSHATGLASVPFDGYTAELHKDEAVLTAKQSNALRDAGILRSNADGTPTLDMSNGGGQPVVSNTNTTSNSSVSPSLTINNLVIQGTGNTEADVTEAIRRAWDNMWQSFNRTNPQLTER